MLSHSETLELVGRLVDRSLVHFDESSGRYHLLETVKQYGQEMIDGSGEHERLNDQFVGYCLDVVSYGGNKVRGADQTEWLLQFDLEYDNLRACLEWLCDRPERWHQALRLSLDLLEYWQIRSRFEEGVNWFNRIRPTIPKDRIAARAQLLTAIDRMNHHVVVDVPLIREAVRLARESGDQATLARAMSGLAIALIYVEEEDEAETVAEQALMLTRTTGDWLMEGFLHINAGNLALSRGRVQRAKDCYEECLKVRGAHGDRRGIAAAIGSLGQISELQNDLESAAKYYIEGCRELARGNMLWDLAGALPGLAVGPWLKGDFVNAALALGLGEALRTQLKTRRDVVDQALYDRWLERVKQSMTEEAFAQAYRKGFEMKLEEGLAIFYPNGLEAPLPLPTAH